MQVHGVHVAKNTFVRYLYCLVVSIIYIRGKAQGQWVSLSGNAKTPNCHLLGFPTRLAAVLRLRTATQRIHYWLQRQPGLVLWSPGFPVGLFFFQLFHSAEPLDLQSQRCVFQSVGQDLTYTSLAPLIPITDMLILSSANSSPGIPAYLHIHAVSVTSLRGLNASSWHVIGAEEALSRVSELSVR